MTIPAVERPQDGLHTGWNRAQIDQDRFLAAIVESADDAIFAKKLDGTILTWNAGAQRMYGYPPEEIVGKTVFQLSPPDRHGEIRGILERIRRGERIEHFETERVRGNGERFPVSLAISPVRDASGEIIGASTVARDITEQRRLLEATQLQQSLLVAQSEASIDGLLVVDRQGGILFANRRFREMWSLPDPVLAEPEEIIVDRLATLVRDPDRLRSRVEGLYGHPTETSRDQIWLLDGRVFDAHSAPVRSETGRLYGRAWNFRDVTTEAVQSAQLRAVIAAVDDAAVVCGPGGKILLRNPAAERLLGEVGSYDEMLGGLRRLERPSPAGGETEEVREYVIGSRDNERHVRLTVRPIEIAASDLAAEFGGSLIGAGSDVGPRPLGSLVLLRDVTELRDVEGSREAFVGILSHELRTPITTIYGASKMLRRRQSATIRKGLLGDIEAEADRLYRLVEDLLVLTRIERESLDIVDEPLLIGPILQRVVAAERHQYPAARLELSLAPALPMGRGESTYVEQVVRNLIGNALKYGPPDGMVRVIAEPRPASIAIRVLDEGPGIGPDERDRIFELLYRSPSTAARAAGSGIGLFVSRRLAEAMGGVVTVRPRAEGGTELILELPIYESDDEDVVGHLFADAAELRVADADADQSIAQEA